jgi:hypothetical protein
MDYTMITSLKIDFFILIISNSLLTQFSGLGSMFEISISEVLFCLLCNSKGSSAELQSLSKWIDRSSAVNQEIYVLQDSNIWNSFGLDSLPCLRLSTELEIWGIICIGAIVSNDSLCTSSPFPFCTSEQIEKNILSRVLVTIDGVRIGWLDLLIPYTINSYLQAIRRYHWFTQFTVHRYTRTMVLSVHLYPDNGIWTVSLWLNLLITH